MRRPSAPASAPAGGATAAAPAVDLTSWWHALKDPELDSLIERAVSGNPDVIIALDRLQAARTFEAGIIGTVLPEAQAAVGGGRGTGSNLARGRAPQAQISAANTTGVEHINIVGGFDALWELDVFGKYRREIEAARYDSQAMLAARNSVLVSVIADIARAYVDLRGLQVRASVLRASIDALRESLRIVSIRYQRGITNELDVTLATRELATLEAQAAPVDAQVRAAEYTIAVLLGAYPEDMVKELGVTAMVPSVPAAVAIGLPVELLRRRPDIQQAERELAAATARIGIATANLFPLGLRLGIARLPAPTGTRTADHRPAYLVARRRGGLAAARLRAARRPGGDRRPADPRPAGQLPEDHPGGRARSRHQYRAIRRGAGEPRQARDGAARQPARGDARQRAL